MKFLCAPDSFKESLGAIAVTQSMVAGIRTAAPQCIADACPVADGGEGTMDVLLAALGGTVHTATVTGPLGAPITARFAISEDGRTGIVELAEASGLARIARADRDPTRTTTYGTGELIARVAAAGCTKIVVGLGGSGTCDGGAGLAQALGVKFFDATGATITAPLTGGTLRDIARIDGSAAVRLPTIIVACDVRNPLLGDNGAAAVYGPQKGATPAQVHELNEGLAQLAERVGADPTGASTGAAGGAGYGLNALCGAKLERGIDLVLDASRFGDRCADADLVLTGEGRLEANSLEGKAAIGVARAARARGTPTIAIVGSTGPGAERCLESAGGPLARYVSLTDRFGPQRAMRDAPACLREAAADVVREWTRHG